MEMKLLFFVALAVAQEAADQLTVTRAMEKYEDYDEPEGSFNATIPTPDSNVLPEPLSPVPVSPPLTETPILIPEAKPEIDTFASVDYVPKLTIDAKRELEQKKHQTLGADTQFIRGRKYESPEIFEARVSGAEAVTDMQPQAFSWQTDAELTSPEFVGGEGIIGVEELSLIAESITDLLTDGVKSFLQIN